MTRPLLDRLLARDELTPADIERIVDRVTDPSASDAERAALLVALRAKGESTEEIAAFAKALRRRALPFPGPRAAGAVDLCGSGGARAPSFNIGTVSAFVVRAAGTPVAKHGNRSARGAREGWAGSSDLLEALDLPFVRSREFARAAFDRERITFLHAPLYHPATRAVVAVRRAIATPTVFNLVGPLSNPARVPYQVVGCPDRSVAARMARVLARLGVRGALTVSSEDGTDEFSARARSGIVLVRDDRFRSSSIDPAQFLDGDDRRGPWGPLPAAEAAEETERLLAGGGGARRGSILLTSGAALWATASARTLAEGVARATQALDSGGAEEVLGRLRDLARARRWPEDSA
ncbi:MAG: anthranilate phosphoribosyltransferase [Thermoplasmata archaeon]